jgi:CPA1 family monovalent cation:H+ antiporter
MVPYAAYLGAEAIDASGVLAVVACGLILSRRSAEIFSPSVRLQVYSVWTAAIFILNGVVFVLIGLQLPGVVHGITDVSLPRLIAYGAACSLLVILLRVLWLFPGARLSYFIRNRILHQTDTRPTPRELLVIGWSGMRGVVTLAAAISLPTFLSNGANFPQRDLIVFLAFSVVISTLVFQGLTLAPLIRALHLAGAAGPDCEERDARRIAVQAALTHLEEARTHDRAEYSAVYDDLAQHYRDQLNAIFCAPEDPAAAPPPHYRKHRTLSHELLGVQRRTLLQLRHQGRINDQVLRNLERDLDLQQARG